MSIDSFTELLEGFDPAALLPELDTVLGRVEFFTRLAVMAGPIVLLVLGVLYFFAAPKEANHRFGYRCYFGMGSEQAWRFTQRIAGITWTFLGAVMTLVMLIVTARFPGQDVLEMLTTAATSVVAEALVLLVATLIIRIIVAARYDRHGERRRRK